MLCFQLYEIQENERLETVERSVAASAWLVGGEGWTGGSQRTSPGSWNTMYDTIIMFLNHNVNYGVKWIDKWLNSL